VADDGDSMELVEGHEGERRGGHLAFDNPAAQ
jgi:hypothetical protein